MPVEYVLLTGFFGMQPHQVILIGKRDGKSFTKRVYFLLSCNHFHQLNLSPKTTVIHVFHDSWRGRIHAVIQSLTTDPFRLCMAKHISLCQAKSRQCKHFNKNNTTRPSAIHVLTNQLLLNFKYGLANYFFTGLPVLKKVAEPQLITRVLCLSYDLSRGRIHAVIHSLTI